MTEREPRLSTGVRNLDALLGGGIPVNSLVAISGAPGSGKTIFAEQLCFHNATPAHRVLYFGTLSEPTAKILRNLRPFAFFDATKLQTSVEFVDLGELSRMSDVAEASALIVGHLKRVRPAIIVIDSFKVFDDLAKSRQELRTFGYDIAVTLMAWEATTFLLGEFGPLDYQTNPLFSIVDGVITLSQREAMGEHQRFLQVVKMRGTDHSRDDHPFAISTAGLDVFTTPAMVRSEPVVRARDHRCLTGISKLDEVIGTGIPWGSSILLSGVAGTGKTVLSLEFIYRGALAGERGIFFSFEETEQRLRTAARGLGWDLDGEVARGMIEIVFIPQPEIAVEADLVMMRDRITALGARRVVIDSLSVFLHKIVDPQLCRDKVFQLCSIVQNVQAVALFPTDIPYGATQISRFGVEETVVDGVILLRSVEEGLERARYLEVYKLRDTGHLSGRHNMEIGRGGIAVFPRYGAEPIQPAPALDPAVRLGSGVAALDDMLRGGLLARSVTLVSGSCGVGKTTLAIQFVLAGASHDSPALYVSLEEGPAQLVAAATALGLPLADAIARGHVTMLHVSREDVPSGELLSTLSDQVVAGKFKRIVIDAITHLDDQRAGHDGLRRVLTKLAVRFKHLGVTSLFTLESASLFSAEQTTGLSPVADNVVMLRYVRSHGGLAKTLTIVKSRGSDHDPRSQVLTIGHGGATLAARNVQS